MIGRITVFTSERPAQLGKVYSLKEGRLEKSTAGNMSEGTYQVKTFDSSASFAALLQTVGTNQALSSSYPRTGEATGRVLVEVKAKAAGVLARTQKDFLLSPGPGVMTLDFDVPKGTDPLSPEELWAKLLQLAPDVARTMAVWWCSSSSYIHGPDGELQGLRGQRLYLLIRDVSDTVRAGAVLRDLCWLHGLGRVELSKSGSKLKRSLWDEAMHEPARLDFIGGAICTAPLSQQRPAPVLMGGTEWLDTGTALPDLTEEQQHLLESLQRAALDRAEEESVNLRVKWASERVAKETIRLQRDKKLTEPVAREQATRLVDAALGCTLHGDYLIPLPNNRSVTVKAVLDNPEKWDKQLTLDPLEPEHRGGEACGILYLTGHSPTLFSFAHGRTVYSLVRQPRTVRLQTGKQSMVADELAQALLEQGDIYYSGGDSLVQAQAGRIKPLERTGVQYVMGHRVRLVTRKADGKDVLCNITAEQVGLAIEALGNKPEQTPPTLKSVTSLPYATADGYEVLSRGYSKLTGVYNTMLVDTPDIPITPSEADLLEALKTLWEPWSEYRWATAADRAGMLAGIFTAVLRPAMETAPGFFLDAPVQGSGKTKAALALGALMVGSHAGVSAFVASRNQEEEYNKHIIALLRSERRFWLIDNVTGVFESAALSGFITSGTVNGRLLGQSKEVNCVGRLLFVATGNNAALGSDLRRRLICCRIDTGMERPTDLAHRFEPSQVALSKRMQIAAAVLTILRAYRQSQRVCLQGGSDFSDWSVLVREPIVWLQQQGYAVKAGIGELVDPAKALGGGEASDDPRQEALLQLLTGIQTSGGKVPAKFLAGELYKEYARVDIRADSPTGLIRSGLDGLSSGRLMSAVTVGYILKNNLARRVGNQRLERCGERRCAAQWEIRTD